MNQNVFIRPVGAIAVGCMVFAASLSLIGMASAAPQTVELDASLDKTEDGDFLVVDMHIETGWHAYAVRTPGAPAEPVSISLKLPEGVETVGELQRPLALPSEKDPEVKIYQGMGQFRQKLKIQPAETQRKIGVIVRYQVCDPKICEPPVTKKLLVSIPPDQTTTRASAGNFTHPQFMAPVMLTVGDQPLNVAAAQMYPSPAVYDVDNDGKLELVVGDIFGSLNVYENAAEWGHGDPVWEEHRPLESADGQPIRVSNW